ncbi:ABC transporter ATP-binding protein [Candidatus Gracilibacteria bacterium]|nr:MAG: ABC transporter ATP-binding protein [Candidatus Gracilibacteria bacterium]
MTSKQEKKTDYKRVFQFALTTYRQFPWLAIGSLLTRLCATISVLVPPIFYKEIIDILSSSTGITNELSLNAIGVLMIILWIKIASFIVYRLYDFWAIALEMNIQERIDNFFLQKLQYHSYKFFSENMSGSLISKFRKGVSAFEKLSDIFSWQILPFITNVTIILIIIGVQNIWISFGIFMVILIFTRLQYVLYKYIHPYQEKANALDSEQGGLLSDLIINNHTIKLFASEKKEERKYAKLNYDTAHARKIQYHKSIWIWGSSAAIGIILEIGIMYLAIRMWGNGTISLGMIVLLQTYILRLIDFLWGIGQTLRHTFIAISEASEVLQIIDTPHEIQDKSSKKLKLQHGAISFNNVNFSYGENQIFHDLNFHIKPGERVALVGESGSGKTTITKLLFRLYDIQKGEILIDDQNIAEVTQESLRSSMSMIPQDPILFHRSIRENIAYGKPNASDEEIIAAAKMARCHEFISHLKDGYETLVGERGIKLSGGERQRVAIARAILENKQIIVMDEATSALDSESEFLIQEAIEELMQNKTLLIIAHRLSTIMKMDKIIVMDQGKIAEKGSHKELLAKDNGIYKKLRNIQSGGFIG